MKKRPYIVTIALDVWDKKLLYKAAKARAIAEGGGQELLKYAGGGINIEACLIMLLDPGSLDGCSIDNTIVENVA
jgi:hypothetical protein